MSLAPDDEPSGMSGFMIVAVVIGALTILGLLGLAAFFWLFQPSTVAPFIYTL